MAAAVTALLASVGMVAFIVLGSDDGVDAVVIGQAIGVGATMAAVPIAVLIRPTSPPRIVSLGGGMTVAGVATMLGGNLAGFLMAIFGAPILWAGASREPRLSTGLVLRLVVHAGFLIAAMWLSLGRTDPATIIVSWLISIGVATSTIWDGASSAD